MAAQLVNSPRKLIRACASLERQFVECRAQDAAPVRRDPLDTTADGSGHVRLRAETARSFGRVSEKQEAHLPLPFAIEAALDQEYQIVDSLSDRGNRRVVTSKTPGIG
jgi:hypothetical protein